MCMYMQVFAGLSTLRKLCNHPDLITNDYSQLVVPGIHGSKGPKQDVRRSHEGEAAVTEVDDEDQDFLVVEATGRSDDEGL